MIENRALPSLDTQDYPVLAGPSAYLPTEPGPPVWRADTGPVPAPQPVDLFRRDLEVPKAVHPEPLVPARTAREVELPSAARTVRKLAEAHSWMVRATYALGWVLGAKGDTRALTHSVALRMHRPGRWVTVEGNCPHVVAVWTVKEPDQDVVEAGRYVPAPPTTGWKFDLAYGWGGGQPHHKLSAVALKETIKEA